VDIEDSEYEMLARHCKGTIRWYYNYVTANTTDDEVNPRTQ